MSKTPSSVMERDIGPHEHEMVIWQSYEVYAICKRCGFHDWSCETVDEYQAKYPTATIFNEFAEQALEGKDGT